MQEVRRRQAAGQQTPRNLHDRIGASDHKFNLCTSIQVAIDDEWRQSWQTQRDTKSRTAFAWLIAWGSQPTRLYNDMSKAEATALFLMRTQVIGLRQWLARAGVPGVSPICPCGQSPETVRHVLLQCSRFQNSRPGLFQQAGTEDIQALLTKRDGARIAARWLVRSGALEQFRVAMEAMETDTSQYRAFRLLRAEETTWVIENW
jgi:hypothetical protein